MEGRGSRKTVGRREWAQNEIQNPACVSIAPKTTAGHSGLRHQLEGKAGGLAGKAGEGAHHVSNHSPTAVPNRQESILKNITAL